MCRCTLLKDDDTDMKVGRGTWRGLWMFGHIMLPANYIML